MTEQKTKLETLLKEHWIPVGNWGETSVMLGKMGERMIFDYEREEIIIKYSTEIKK
jgi:hypothetical protein